MTLRGHITALFAAVAIQIALPIAAGATPLLSASLDDSSGDLLMTFHNEGLTSGDDIVSIVIDGGTALDFPVLWDYAGFPIGPPGADVHIVGENTRVLTITFSDDPDGFNGGESFTLEAMDPDGDPGPAGVILAELIGVEVTVTTRDGSPPLVAHFAPGQSDALVLIQVPEPAGVALLLLGLAATAVGQRRRSQASAAKRSRSAA